MFGPIKAVVFDFDGTLVNTMPSVIRGLSAAVEFGSGVKQGEAELLASFGPAPQDVLKKWVPPNKVEAAFQHWLDFEKALPASSFAIFAHVEELLQGLLNLKVPMGVFTGRDRAGTLRIMQHHQWLGKYFSEDQTVCGDDGFPTKPHPGGLIALMSRMAWNPPETLMVGDHPHDMSAGRAAGAKTGAVLWDKPEGPGTHRSRFRDSWNRWPEDSSDVRLASPLSLLEWLKKVVP